MPESGQPRPCPAGYDAAVPTSANRAGRVREPEFPPRQVSGRGWDWYRGDCHVHSQLSQGGELTPSQLAAAARAARLDFIAITEHNTADTHGAWGALAGDDLLVILGQEITTQSGHWLALGLEPGQVVDWRYGVRDGLIDVSMDQVHRAGGLCVAAHPYAPYPSGTFMYPFLGFDAVEVWNGRWSSDLPWNADNEAALADWGRSLASDICHGRWRPAIGNSDAHLDGQLGVPHTVVLSEGLGTGAILAGIRAGRSWIAESAEVRLSLSLTAGGRRAGIGERLITDGEAATVRVEIRGVPSGTVSFHTEQGGIHREQLPDHDAGTVEWSLGAQDSAFVRIEVRHPSGQMAALTNPILLT
ncbi:CehA/McbA family metallohydrolase [Micromonospora sp. NPDC049523]|uniref:CehA/McbA family metallohydrolase n=1 Tax=Micromonospora sp. NPDC049523 TaxID=3155921 RepID=UPI0034243EEB